jgi:tRNA A37 threonylcarbamoyltransferase TsaD
VPEIASRLHEEKIMDLLEEIGIEKIKSVDFISVTAEPGLPGSLIV